MLIVKVSISLCFLKNINKNVNYLCYSSWFPLISDKLCLLLTFKLSKRYFKMLMSRQILALAVC